MKFLHILAGALLAILMATQSPLTSAAETQGTVLITGANRGIGPGNTGTQYLFFRSTKTNHG